MEKDNYLKNAELSTEQNYNMIDGIPNNAPLPVVQAMPEEKPKDRVKEPPAKCRSFPQFLYQPNSQTPERFINK